MDREISPPPLKRRKIQISDDAAEDEFPKDLEGHMRMRTARMGSKSAQRIRLFSWNINGIQPFLPAPNASITSFFKPVKHSDPTGAGGAPAPTVTEAKSAYAGNPLREFLQRHRWPEILFLQEIKISPLDKKTPSALLNFVNTPLGKDDTVKPDTRYTLDVNLPRDKHNARGFGGKIYGVGTLLREDFASQYLADIRHADWDLEGRVTIVELRAKKQQKTDQVKILKHTDTQSLASDSKQIKASLARDNDRGQWPLALLNIYAVNGTTAPYRSPETGQVVGTRHDHKLAFHTRLRDECLELERRGFSVVMAGDLNIARGRLDGHPNLRTFPRQHCINRADFNAKFFGSQDNTRAEAYLADAASGDKTWEKARESRQGTVFDGVDVFRALKGKERRYTYHPRSGEDWGSSCDRVDFIVVSKVLVDAERVLDADILDSPQERGTSDHVPITANILLDGALSDNIDESPLRE